MAARDNHTEPAEKPVIVLPLAVRQTGIHSCECGFNTDSAVLLASHQYNFPGHKHQKR